VHQELDTLALALPPQTLQLLRELRVSRVTVLNVDQVKRALIMSCRKLNGVVADPVAIDRPVIREEEHDTRLPRWP
jgi:hypothetical protein